MNPWNIFSSKKCVVAMVTIREATPDDYEDVLAIRRVYRGRDYLKDCYHDILSRHKGFVAVLNDEIVILQLHVYIFYMNVNYKRTFTSRQMSNT